MDEEKRKRFEDAVRPAMKFLNEECHPHMTIIVEPTKAELVEGVTVLNTDEYIKD